MQVFYEVKVMAANKKRESTISIYGAEELKIQIRFLITFNHPENHYHDLTESKLAKSFLNKRRTVNDEYLRVKRLENDLFS